MRTKPTRELKASTHEASGVDYELLARAVVEHITFRKKNIYLRYPYFATFAEDYPKGIIVKRDGIFDIYKVKVQKLADFLHSKGYLPENYKNIMKAQRDWGYREARLERMLTGEITVDNIQQDRYNDVSVDEGDEE